VERVRLCASPADSSPTDGHGRGTCTDQQQKPATSLLLLVLLVLLVLLLVLLLLGSVQTAAQM
jgi:hypothetical protein